jgi:hypothetical protein
VFLASVRLGASVATLVASGRDDVEGLILWEPAVDGLEYEQDISNWNEEKQFYFLTKIASTEKRFGLLGFELSETMLKELRELDLRTIKRRPAEKILVIESAPSIDDKRPSVTQFCQHAQILGTQVDYRQIESFKMWVEDPDKGLVPQPIIQAALSWLDQEGD